MRAGEPSLGCSLPTSSLLWVLTFLSARLSLALPCTEGGAGAGALVAAISPSPGAALERVVLSLLLLLPGCFWTGG